MWGVGVELLPSNNIQNLPLAAEIGSSPPFKNEGPSPTIVNISILWRRYLRETGGIRNQLRASQPKMAPAVICSSSEGLVGYRAHGGA